MTITFENNKLSLEKKSFLEFKETKLAKQENGSKFW